jgi:Tol biopolymer transport system component
MRVKSLLSFLAATAALTIGLAPQAVNAAHDYWSDWSLAVPVAEVNSPQPDGCPIESRDGLSLYIASMRPGTLGGNDIWAADRASKNEPFGPPKHLDDPVNSAANDFCPTPIHGSYLLFVSERPGETTCGSGPGVGDIYIVRRNAASGWGQPRHLGCAEDGTGPNTAGAEFSPSLVTTDEGTFLYFSSTVSGNHDIYKSRRRHDGSFGPPEPVTELNTEFDDRMPNVSADGLEIVFSSTRTTDARGVTSFGSFDVYVSRRSSTRKGWSAPVNLGQNVNSPGSETRATMSWDGRRLYFGRDGDIYTSSRVRMRAGD